LLNISAFVHAVTVLFESVVFYHCVKLVLNFCQKRKL